jgi:hypothetical protein
MNSTEIQDLGIKASETYYNYLDENNLGRVIVEVYAKELVSTEDRIYKLRLAKKLFDLDAIVFTDLTSNKQYDTSSIKIVEYDVDRNFLIVQIPPESGFPIENLHYRDIVIVSDLKFLVQRVTDWYRKNGKSVALPSQKQTVNTEIDFFAELPNDEQKEAIRNILTSPFSYIWGAPGTGKTQLVLSYVITKYIEQGTQVAIFAPTNNAIEQVLRGVINKTDKAGIDRTQIIRLGNPTKAFAEQFPEVCEAKGIMKKINEIDKQIEIIKKVIETENLDNEYQKIKKALDEFDKLDKEVNLKEDLKAQIEKSKHALNILWSNLKNENDRLQRELDILGITHDKIQGDLHKLTFEAQRLEKSINSFFHSIKKVFSGSTLTKEENRMADILPLISSKQKELNSSNKRIEIKEQAQKKELDAIKIKIAAIENTQASLMAKLNDNNFITNTLSFIRNEVAFNSEATKILSDLNLSNRSNKKSQLGIICQKLGSELLVSKSITEDYSLFSYKKLHEILGDFEKQREFLKKQTTEERLKGVNIVGCTLDCYIGRFVDNELPASHFFLDEAGYACAIKALTMFRSGKPVTFLGDHLQLPPVCELNDDKLTVKEEYKDVFIWSQSAIFVGDIFTKSKEEAFQDYLDNNEPKFNQGLEKSDLKKTHRFGENLAQVLNRYVYENGFSSAQINGTTRIKFIHATNHIPPTARRANFGEAQTIQNLVNSGRYDTTDLVILTPYKNQIIEIGKLLPELRKEHKILTVHGSQGREWKTVILSVSDTSDMWFTNSKSKASKGKNLINTAVSRAKEELIIVCDHNYWIKADGQLIQALLQIASKI